MTDSEAIKELQDNIDLPFGFTVSDEASIMAINALEKQNKIKEAFTHYAFNGYEMNILSDCLQCLAEIKDILNGSEEE